MYYRCRDILEAECLVATLAMKMSVQVVDFARAACTAYRIFERTCPVIDAVYQVVRKERVMVRKIEDLSIVSSIFSKSSKETERPALSMACNTNMRMAVGCISLFANKAK